MSFSFPVATYPMNVAMVLEYIAVANLGQASYNYSGDLSANTEAAFNSITWSDMRTKPLWSEILDNHIPANQYNAALSNAAYEAADHPATVAATAAIATLVSRMDAVEGVNSSQTSDLATLAASLSTNASHPVTNVARTLGTAYRPSTARSAIVVHSVEITSVATLIGSQKGEVIMEISADGVTGWTAVNKINNGNSVSLAIALTATQIFSGVLAGVVPAGYYYRLRTNNVTGSPSYTTGTGQETLI